MREVEEEEGGEEAEAAKSSGQIFLRRCSATRVGKCDTISDDANRARLGSERIPELVQQIR